MKTLILTPNKMERIKAERRRWYQKYRELIKTKNNFYYHHIKKRIKCICGKDTITGRCSSCALRGKKRRKWSLQEKISRSGKNNPHWKGEEVKLSGLKAWVKRNKLKPNLCEQCNKKQPFDLAKISEKDVRDVNNYKWLCRTCSMTLDGRLKNIHKNVKQRRLNQVIPSKDTKIEIKLQNELSKRNIKFTKHKPIIGQPDIFIEPNICIFADGDYWHNLPTSKEKDQKITNELKNLGYKVLRFWEHEIVNNIDNCINTIEVEL